MRSNSLPLFGAEPLSKPKLQFFPVHAHWLAKDDCRLDASFYADEAIAARRIVEDSGFGIQPLGNSMITKEIFNLYRFKRIYTNDPGKGWPYLSASEALMFRPQSERWIARDKAPKQAKKHFAKEGWLLISCSGVVGRCVLVMKHLEKFFLTHDLIRVVSTIPSGYLYALLSTWMGQALMRKEQYGMTVTHLEPHHVEKLPVPLIPEKKQQEIHQQILKAYRLRDEANDLLDQAERRLYSELGLPQFDESKVPYLTTPDPELEERKLKVFAMKASELADRFDVSFHLPIVKACVEQMRKGKYKLMQLGEVADPYVAPRFKRVYVESEYGIPFLQGSHIPLMKPYDLKYLSRRAHKDLSRWIIKEGWVLVTCSGTIGRVAITPKQLDGWAASQHIERIISKGSRLHAGYIAAFLMTPYGQHQLTSKVYGGVVDELTEEDTAAVWLPDVPPNVHEKIGKLVVSAFEKREEANQIEDGAVKVLEKLIDKKL